MPHASYVATGDSPLIANKELIERLAAHDETHHGVSSTVVPVRSGHAFPVAAGQIVRFTTVDGPQVVDLNLWARDDTRERFWAARTRQF